MDEILENIESYFENRLNPVEKTQFEERCVNDESFCRDVAFYISTRQLLKNDLLKQKQIEWEGSETYRSRQGRSSGSVMSLWPAYAAAASIIIIIAAYFIFKPSSPRQLAETYVEKNLTELSVTMGDSNDSLQQGLNAFNAKRLTEAQTIFTALYISHPENRQALRYSGITYLATKEYDKAIEAFKELEKTGVYSNPGYFYEALALMLRSGSGDKQQAKDLLQKVVSEKLEGLEDAQLLLKKL